jgi:hypothetical protein
MFDSLEMAKVPAEIVVPSEYVFALVKTRVPLPILTKGLPELRLLETRPVKVAVSELLTLIALVMVASEDKTKD